MNRTEENEIKAQMKRDIIATALLIPDGKKLDDFSNSELMELYELCIPLIGYMLEKGFTKSDKGYKGRREDK